MDDLEKIYVYGWEKFAFLDGLGRADIHWLVAAEYFLGVFRGLSIRPDYNIGDGDDLLFLCELCLTLKGMK